MWRSLLLACCLLPLCFSEAFAQMNELSLIGGGGRLSDGDSGVNASAFTFAYTRSLVAGVAVEGSLDVFFVTSPMGFRDDFGAAQIAAVYQFGSIGKTRRIIPYISAGVGKISTDFTEIPGEVVYRFGGGAKYYFSERAPFGLRIELRDEITRRGGQGYPLTGARLSLVSLRAGFTCRF
jgi:hypothetical protein